MWIFWNLLVRNLAPTHGGARILVRGLASPQGGARILVVSLCGVINAFMLPLPEPFLFLENSGKLWKYAILTSFFNFRHLLCMQFKNYFTRG